MKVLAVLHRTPIICCTQKNRSGHHACDCMGSQDRTCHLMVHAEIPAWIGNFKETALSGNTSLQKEKQKLTKGDECQCTTSTIAAYRDGIRWCVEMKKASCHLKEKTANCA